MNGLSKIFSFISIFFLILPAMEATAQTATFSSRLDSTSMLIGDQTGMTLTFEGPAEALVFWPAIPDTILGNIQVIRRTKIDSLVSADRSRLTLTQKFTLTCFDSGFYTIPPIPVAYRLPPDTLRREARSELMMLMVKSVPVDTTQAIKPIKGPMRIPVTFREMLPWILLGLGVVALTLIIIWYLRRRKKRKPLFVIRPKVELKPSEKALQELGKLREKRIWQQGQIKVYYSELTDILRVYIEEQFRISAMESTTSEIMEALPGTDKGIPAGPRNNLFTLLTDADLVKFAKALPLPSENEKSMEVAVDFVRQTLMQEVPA
jgi:hypothetical protein